MVWNRKKKVAKITCTYFGDKSQKFAPTEKNQLYGITLMKNKMPYWSPKYRRIYTETSMQQI